MGHLLSLREGQGCPEGTGQLGSSQTALCASEATEAGQIDRRVPARPGCSLGPLLDDGGMRQRLVADGSFPRRPGSDEHCLVQGSRPRESAGKVFAVTTLTETAGYGEYVRWCGR